jgi:hypothetical protein
MHQQVIKHHYLPVHVLRIEVSSEYLVRIAVEEGYCFLPRCEPMQVIRLKQKDIWLLIATGEAL